jgi:hypothetical protein
MVMGMLQLEIPGGEFFNDETQEFVKTKPQKLLLEHSLLSVSKWESKWKKPFFSKQSKTPEEYIDYIRCMTINSNVDPLAYDNISVAHFRKIMEYIDDPHTATTFSNRYGRKSKRARTITSELLYFWMFANGIPKECEKWHLNRLMTLIRIFSIENDPDAKKMSRSAIYQQNRELNEARRAKYHTSG